MRAPLEPAFLALAPGDGNQRFTIFHPPGREPLLGRVVQVHAFGEEMNKSRRMVAQQARALARAGFAVFQIDLFGCGDSAGDFGEATWQRWLDDVVWAARHLRQRMAQASVSVPPTPLWLWGHRAGALLAVEAAVRLGEEEPCHLLLWQPTLAGRSTVQQFLRLKMAAGLADGGAKGVTESLRRDLAKGRAVDVAGYKMRPELAADLEYAQLRPPARPGHVIWLEVSSAPGATHSLATRQAADSWHEAGWQVQMRMIQGPSFWQTIEIEDAPALIDVSLEALLSTLALDAQFAGGALTVPHTL